MAVLTDIPIELFLDNIFPLLPISDLSNLSCTNRFFYELASDEAYWHRRIQEDFNFSGSETARSTGWKFIYKRLAHPRVFVWGERSHKRLGLADNEIPRTSLRDGVPFPVQLRIPGVRIVNIVAGGMSFHALDAHGDIYVWGALDGISGALNSDGFSEPAKRAEQPMRLGLPVKFRSISCGRLHCTALDAASRVWTFTSWGRPFQLLSSLLDNSSPETTPVQVESGWAFSSVLTESGDVLVYWPFSGHMREIIATKNIELDQQSSRVNTQARPTHQEPRVVPCYAWDLQDANLVRLPAIPAANLPQISGTGLSDEQSNMETKLVKIAGMDNAIIGLTNKGHVLGYGSLAGEDTYEQGRWRYLPDFSEVARVRAHPTFDSSSEGEEHPEPPEKMLVTHISAHFKTFVAYSTGVHSVVLMGKIPSELQPVSHTTPPLEPIILPALQNRSVISVVLGDYHYGALTATGKLLTWGAFSKGALGLGDPAEIPVGKPGGYAQEEQRRNAATRFGYAGFIAPPEVRVPTEVRFDVGEKRKKERYCFAVAAAGWHMGALVIDLEPDEEEDEDDGVTVSMPGAFPSHEDGHLHTLPSAPHLPQAPGAYPTLPFRRGGGLMHILPTGGPRNVGDNRVHILPHAGGPSGGTGRRTG